MTSYTRYNQLETAAGQQTRSTSNIAPKTVPAPRGLAASRWAGEKNQTPLPAKHAGLKPAPANQGLAASKWAGDK